MAHEVIFLSSTGVFQLGNLTPFGVQTSVDNFLSFQEAKDWAEKNRTKFKCDIGGGFLEARYVDALILTGPDFKISHASAVLGWSAARVLTLGKHVKKLGIGTVSLDRKVSERTIVLTPDARSSLLNYGGR
ncbi:hypothetical protein [Asaia krungthepensis]|uniref:Uncharacterized protein n=1 Tax=Asaia krungthepensis NRIC 0535 TaxID=1307925 RepID=A0ABQ0Q340_9PROT|nr:hypothetical protein [Asaia krungthepensis]GBQ89075.1 hypothetical protein AA0535_1705 [Asaia krungthepensis NRIC 0535]